MEVKDIENERTLKVVMEILTNKLDLKDNFEVVGEWVWCKFEAKPSEEIRIFLSNLGFRWNRKRKVWQNPCGVYSRGSDDDPKKKYPILQL